MKKLTLLLGLTAVGTAIKYTFADRVFGMYCVSMTVWIAIYFYREWQLEERIRKEPILMELAKAENARIKLELENAQLAQKAGWTEFMKS